MLTRMPSELSVYMIALCLALIVFTYVLRIIARHLTFMTSCPHVLWLFLYACVCV